MIASPVNEPDTEALLGVAAGAEVVVLALADGVAAAVAVEVVVFFFVVVAAGVLLLAVTAAALGAVAAGVLAVVAAELEVFDVVAGREVAAEAPDRVESPLFPNCGGVTDKTAPRPPTVPPAISSARFMPYLFFLNWIV